MTTKQQAIIYIPGQPMGKASVRSGAGRSYTPKATEDEMKRVALAAGDHYRGPTMQPPIEITITAVLRRPKRLCRKSDSRNRLEAPVKPDGSNIQKLLEDGLQRCRTCGGQDPGKRVRKSSRCMCGDFRPTIGDDSWITRWYGVTKYAAILDSGEQEEPCVRVGLREFGE